MSSTEYDVKGNSCSFAVYNSDNVRVTQFYVSQERAEAAKDRMNKKHSSQLRNCMCCGKEFLSEGIHNRLCNGGTGCGATAADKTMLMGHSPWDAM